MTPWGIWGVAGMPRRAFAATYQLMLDTGFEAAHTNDTNHFCLIPRAESTGFEAFGESVQIARRAVAGSV